VSESLHTIGERMKKSRLLCMLLCVLSGSYLSLQAQTPGRQLALTIDDLPLAEDARSFKEMERITGKLLSALAAHSISATGFVNERKIYVEGETDARINLLRMWLRAGMTLGNHTFSHADFNKLPLPEYEDEVIRGEVITRLLMQQKGFQKLYFRYPYNHTGTTREAKEAFQVFLKSRGYEIAPFTVEHEDYVFAAVYTKAKRKRDRALARRIRAAYLDHLDTMFNYFERRSLQLLGYEVRQVFLIHVNEINADCMEEMIARLKRRGYSFVTLDEALQDKAYQLKDDYVGQFGISWLHRWMIGLGKKLDYRDEPDAPKFIADLYRTN
jgi:peptidoglycan/xylan/chitin deacetylase (PgdA/CDA1 family)